MPSLSLKKIEVAYFRGVRKKVTLDFTNLPAGLYFVQGKNEELGNRLGSNGAGKSSLWVDSLYWALRGSIARSTRPGSIVENRYASKNTTKVVIVLEIDGEPFIIERTRNPNNLEINGVKREQRDVDLALPITDAALRRSLLLAQFGEMFLDLRPEAKSQIFTETLNLDVWLEASDRAGERLRDVERQSQKAETEAASALSVLEEVRRQLEEAVKAEAEFDDKIEADLKEAKQIRADARKAASSAFTALNKARQRLADVDTLDDAVRSLESKKSQHRKLARQFADVEAGIQACEREVERLIEKLKEYQNTKVCPECGQSVPDEHIMEQKEKLESQLGSLKSKLRFYENDDKTFSAQYQRLTKEIEEGEKQLVEFREAQSEVSVAAERSIAADREKVQAEKAVITLTEAKNPFTTQCDALEERRHVLRGKVKEVKVVIEKLNKEVEIYKFWQRGFREIRLEQIDSTLLELEMATNRHAESLGLDGWEIQFATEREKKTGGLSHGFSVSLYLPGEKEPVPWETYSGGESQRWQLATTFGLAEVLLSRAGIEADFEVVDEPSVHLSPEGIDDLLDCLYNRAHELNRRIFLIDHHSLDRGLFDGVYTVVKDKNGTRLVDGPGYVQKRERERL